MPGHCPSEIKPFIFNHSCLVPWLAALALVLLWPASSAAAAPPAPSQATVACDATVGGNCYVNGSFTMSASSPGAHHYRVCRSNDTSAWGGCNVVMTTNTGGTYTVSGGHLPSNGFRRAYYWSACDINNNCSLWSQNTPVYVYMDNVGPTAPGNTTVACDYVSGSDCWVQGNFTVSVTPASDSGSGVAGYQICRSGDSSGSFAGCQVNLTLNGGTSLPINGSHLPSDGSRRSYWFRAKDKVGNWGSWNSPRYVRVDRYAPTVSGTISSAIGRQVVVNAADSTAGSAANSGLQTVRYRWGNSLNSQCNNGSVTQHGATLTATGSTNHLYLCAKDKTGRMAFWNQDLNLCPVPRATPNLSCSSTKAADTLARRLAEVPASEEAIHRALGQTLERYELVTLDPRQMERELSQTNQIQLAIAGRAHEVVLEPHELRAPGYLETVGTAEGEVALPWTPTNTFKGYVAGYPESQARFLVHPNLFMGFVDVDGHRYFIDPAYKFEPGASPDRAVIYEATDLRPDGGITCAAQELHELESTFGVSGTEVLMAQEESPPVITERISGSGCQQIRFLELATDADFEYYSLHLGNTNQHILGILNMVEGFYSDIDSNPSDGNLAFGVRFSVTSQRYFDVNNDPYSTCQIDRQWCELWNEWETNRGHITRDLAHLWSGKDLFFGGTQIRGNVGNLGALCRDPELSYLLSTDYREVGLVAHEIGHTFNLRHLNEVLSSTQHQAACPEDCTQLPCTTPPPGQGPVMCGAVHSTTLPFHSESVLGLENHVASYGSCIPTTLIICP